MSARALPARLVLLGHPVQHSLSPLFQQAALDHCRIPLRYEALDIGDDEFDARVKALLAGGAAGNVTLPYKQRMLGHCASLSATAARARAVNTFWCDASGTLNGDNTDVGGFLFAARRLLGENLGGLRVVMLGAGGAAAGVIEALRAVPGATLTVHARNPSAALALLAARERDAAQLPLASAAQDQAPGAFGATDGSRDALRAALAGAHLVVNATSLGIEGNDELPLPADELPADCAALDLTYRRDGLTPWVRALRERHRAAEDGITMLLEQGALAFERWFDYEAPRAVMARALGR